VTAVARAVFEVKRREDFIFGYEIPQAKGSSLKISVLLYLHPCARLSQPEMYELKPVGVTETSDAASLDIYGFRHTAYHGIGLT
jgi:hypothetical protein